MEGARRTRDLYGRATVLFLDEIHRFSKAQQDALLPGVEAVSYTHLDVYKRQGRRRRQAAQTASCSARFRCLRP